MGNPHGCQRCSPGSTFDFSLKNGDGIPIEERDENEVLMVNNSRLGPVEGQCKSEAGENISKFLKNLSEKKDESFRKIDDYLIKRSS